MPENARTPVRFTEGTVTSALSATPTIEAALLSLIGGHRDNGSTPVDFALDAGRDRLAACLGAVLDDLLLYAGGINPVRRTAIRELFLGPRQSYTPRDLAEVWRIPEEHVCTIFSDEIAAAPIDLVNAATDFHIERADAVGATATFHLLRPVEIEVALSDDFLGTRPEEWLTVPALVFVPRLVAAELMNEPTLLGGQASVSVLAEASVCTSRYAK